MHSIKAFLANWPKSSTFALELRTNSSLSKRLADFHDGVGGLLGAGLKVGCWWLADGGWWMVDGG